MVGFIVFLVIVLILASIVGSIYWLFWAGGLLIIGGIMVGLLTLFVVGSIGFWLLIGLASIMLFYCVEEDRGGLATTSIIATLFLLYFFGDLNIFGWAIENFLMLVLSIGGYFVVGTIWAIVKWWFFVRRNREKYDDAKAKFLRDEGIEGTSIPDDQKKDWKSHISSSYNRGFEIKPEARKHKSRVLTWMTYWPWSMVWTLIDDPVKKLFRYIYRLIQDLLQKMSDRAFAGTENDFPTTVKTD